MKKWPLGFKTRELTPELMDDFSLDLKSHIQALQGLERIHRVSFTAAPIWNEIEKYFYAGTQKTLRVLDVACGGGDLVVELTRKAKKKHLPFFFEGCDFNPRAVEYAKQCAEKKKISVNYFVFDALRDPIPAQFDIVISSLFLHHLEKVELLRFLKKLGESSAKLIILSDLKRSHLGWLMAHVAGQILSRSLIVHIDGPRSVRAAFSCEEILRASHDAGLTTARVRSIWPERYLLTARRP